MMIDYLIQLENQAVLSAVSQKFEHLNEFGCDISVEMTQVLPGLGTIVSEVHTQMLLDLIYTYFCSRFPEEPVKLVNQYFITNNAETYQVVRNIQSTQIPTFCEQLHTAFLNSKFDFKRGKLVRTKSKEQLIEKGAVYTQPHICSEIVAATITNLATINQNTKILDFACGTGRFYEAIVSELSTHGITPDDAVTNNVVAIDIDPDAVNITRLKAISLLDTITEEKLHKVKSNVLMKNGLLRTNLLETNEMAISRDDHDGLFFGGFDAIVSNPPYLVLKPNKSKAGKNNSDGISSMVSYFRKCGHYNYSIEGMLNLYQLSIESMLSMLKVGGEMGVICPSTLFADVSASKLRRHLLSSNKIRAIKYFAERIPLFENVAQATNIFFLQKGRQTDDIRLTVDESNFTVNIALVKELFPENLEIPFIGEQEWSILYKLSKEQKLKDLPFIRNRRGELDLTLCKQYITTDFTPFRLVRGNMIGEAAIKDVNGEYVSEEFLQTRSADFLNKDFKHRRLICQQISNGGCSKRLKFVFCESSDILGNSCNYLSSDENTLDKLFLLLNSTILNWRFKITSSNNHINNYELDELPIADLNRIDSNFKFSTQTELDSYIGQIYGLTRDEIQLIACS